jgi:predicted TIM-barrel fold metal-dependent hydrolase
MNPGAGTQPPTERLRVLRETIGHPVVDADGHLIESVPLLSEYVRRVGGAEAPARLLRALREATTGLGDAARGDARGVWWGVTNDARDLAAVMSPALLAERLEEIGLDFAVLYPTVGLVLPTIPEDEVRGIACRALNTMNAALAGPYGRRLTVAAAVPMHTPAEAVAELEHAVRVLGFKAAFIPPGVGRPLAAYPEAFPAAQFVDRFGLDSAHDYDPVWRAFVELGVAVTSHGAVGLRHLECGRRSPSSYVFNHIGAHAFQQGELAKALVLGGVPRRFPGLTFAFLEGGAGWACDLLHHLEEHYEKRSVMGLARYDPARLDREALRAELARAGFPTPDAGPIPMGGPQRPDWARDEFEASGLEDEAQLGRLFAEQLFFGCEADDRSVHRALCGRGNPFGLRLNAVFSSDIGHWDVPDLGRVVLESRRLADEGLLAPADYRDFVFANPTRLHLAMNPRFFEGTAVEGAVRAATA